MRHGKKFNHLGRTSAHRKAMLANMASSLILHKRIKTTLAKAKALRQYVEPLITKSKDDSTHSRRTVFSYLHNKEAVSELFREISVKVADRPGGYTRILKIGTRLGDNAEMCMIELVDYNENLLTEKAAKQKKSRRRRGTGKKKETEQVVDTITEEVVEQIVEEEGKTEIPDAEAEDSKPEEKSEQEKVKNEKKDEEKKDTKE
jgi:large subunit ribosomal protein L17